MSKPRSLPIDQSYLTFLRSLKERIRQAQVRSVLAVNSEVILLYWQIGREILHRQQQEGWGTKVIDRLAKDLKAEFKDVGGFSPRNLKYMRALAEAYPDEQIVLRYAAQIPWRHNQVLIDKVKVPTQRLWYAQKSIENGWSRDVLVLQIESDLYTRQGGAITNFARTLPGVSTYSLRNELPPTLQNCLPTVEQLEMELEAVVSELGSGES